MFYLTEASSRYCVDFWQGELSTQDLLWRCHIRPELPSFVYLWINKIVFGNLVLVSILWKENKTRKSNCIMIYYQLSLMVFL